MRSRFLRPSADDLQRLLDMAAAVNAVPVQQKLDAMEPLTHAIAKARPYVARPEVTWVYFPRPLKVIHKGKTRNVLALCERFHFKFTIGEQDPIFTTWKDHIGRFEYSKLNGNDIVRVHLSSHEAREALIGKPMDLGYFGIVTLQSAPIDPWDSIQYIDIPNLPYKDWHNVAAGFAALGAMPSFYGCRQGLNDTGYSDATPRFYFDRQFPACLTIGGKLPRQISHGGRLYLVFVKGYSPPRMADPRKPCSELLTLHPPTRKTPADTSPSTITRTTKRPRTNPTPTTPTIRRRTSATIPPPEPPTEEIESEAISDARFQTALSSIPTPTTSTTHPAQTHPTPPTCKTPLHTLWTPVPGIPPSLASAPHAQLPARLFDPDHCTYKSKGFPYKNLDAQYVTLTRGRSWPTDLSPTIRRVRQHLGRLVLSPTALTMISLDKWLEDNEKSLPTTPQVMQKIEDEIDPDLAPTHASILDHIRTCQPHAVVKVIQAKYVAAQCSLASLARAAAAHESQLADELIHQHFFQRVLSTTTPLHCCAFPTKFADLYKIKANGPNLRQALHDFMQDPLLSCPLPRRPTGTHPRTVGHHELALAWFELHLMAQAPIFYANHEAHSLLADGLAVNRLPCWNSELLPSWLLQRIVQSPLGKTIIRFMNLVAPNFTYNQMLLHETQSPIWYYPNMDNLSIGKSDSKYTAQWLPPPHYPPQTTPTTTHPDTDTDPSA